MGGQLICLFILLCYFSAPIDSVPYFHIQYIKHILMYTEYKDSILLSILCLIPPFVLSIYLFYLFVQVKTHNLFSLFSYMLQNEYLFVICHFGECQCPGLINNRTVLQESYAVSCCWYSTGKTGYTVGF